MTYQKGLTLIEIFMTLVILGILVSIAVPSYNALIQGYKARTLSTEFISSLALARSEAVRQNTNVAMCAAADANLNTCGTDWTHGWIVFVDNDGNGDIANNADKIKVHSALEQGTTVTAASSNIVYNSRGFVKSGAGDYILNASDCAGNDGRNINIANTGRVSITSVACD